MAHPLSCRAWRLALLLLIASVFSSTAAANAAKKYKFVLAPKSADNIFFDAARDGCMDRARALGNIECIYYGPTVFEKTGVLQATMLQELLDNHTDIDGISISVRGAEFMRPVIDAAIERGIPVITFDSDDPQSKRVSYVGTDNYFFGEQLGKVLKQIHPDPGTFAIISDTPQNIVDRENGVRDVLLREGWVEVAESPQYEEGNGTLAIEQMRYVANTVKDITAIIPVMGAPMFLENPWKELVEEFRNVTFVVADGLPLQLSLLSQNYGHGLVAQLPYEMGSKSVDTLLALKQAMEANEGTAMAATVPTDMFPDFQGNNVLMHLQIPLVLPKLIVNENHLGNLSIIGFTLFAVIAAMAIGCVIWTWTNRRLGVVKMAQPGFLMMIAIGNLVMGSTIVPLSFDDSKDNYTESRGVAQCMSIPWLAFLGFTITFSALLAKTWRVNQLFRNSGQFQRVKVTAGQVGKPFLLLFFANTAVLTIWTILDPLQYERLDMPGTDGWNRVIATYGTCRSENATPYVSVLATLNVLVLGIANWQAYRARNIKSEFSEAHYIGITMASLLQATLIGVPLLALVKDLPQAFYLTLVFILFTVTMVILTLIFVPKIAYTKLFKEKSAKSQRRLIQESIADSAYIARQDSTWSTKGGPARNRRVSFMVDDDGSGRSGRSILDSNDGSGRSGTRSILDSTSVQDFVAAANASKALHQGRDIYRDEEDGLAWSGSGKESGSDESMDIDSMFEEVSDRSSSWRRSVEMAKTLQDITDGNRSQSKRLNGSCSTVSNSLTSKQSSDKGDVVVVKVEDGSGEALDKTNVQVGPHTADIGGEAAPRPKGISLPPRAA